VIFGHLGLNLFDDYFDYINKKSDYRDEMAHKGFRARIGKSPYLNNGSASLSDLLLACCIFCGIALLMGVLLLYFRGSGILCFILLSAVLGISYSGRPLKLSYIGLGELLIGVMFGPMVMLGTFYAACGSINMMIIFISVPVGLLVANIVYVHSILDFEPDKEVGKHTLAVLLNNKAWMLVALSFMLFTPYLIILVGTIFGFIELRYLLIFATFPLAGYLFYMMKEYVKDPARKFTPRKWMGPMSNWDRIQTAGIGWFMIRWYLARNLLSAFCFILMLVCLF
jgi:1,4-dihydroxy-2-naphthoate octaprenyltransferase